MATSVDYIEFVVENLHGCSGDIRYRKMFGEYMVYINDKPILLVCDSTVFVKKKTEIEGIMGDADCGVPYNGAKEHYILDIENSDLTKEVVAILDEITPIPKPRKKKEKK